MVNIVSLLHTSIIVNDLLQSIDFYEGLLGLKADLSRPDLGYPGRWYTFGSQQIHLMELPDPENNVDIQIDRPEHVGRDRHIAVQVDSTENLAKLLDSNQIKYTLSRSGRKAIFCRDPDGNGIEFVEVS